MPPHRRTCPLAVLVRAGLEGILAGLETPPIFSGDPEQLDETARARLGLRRLPASLPAALESLEADDTVKGWFSPRALDTYTGMKRMELKLSEGMDDEALCQRYSRIY